MPLKTPAPASRSSGKAKGKTVTSSNAKGKAPQAKAKAAPRAPRTSQPPEPVSVSWWSTLSPERKLDVVCAIMAVVGILTVLILVSAQRSALTGSMLGVIRWMLGWGMYILPGGLIIMGTWLILRRIEKLPRLSLERATGIVLFFLWLLTLMHSIVPLEMAEQAVLDGIGGGYIGSLFARVLVNGFGLGGAIIALLAWLLITLTMIFDLTVADLFRWVPPLMTSIRAWLQTPINKTAPPVIQDPEISSNGYTPLHRPQPVVTNETPGVPIRTVRTAEPVVNWQLPDIKQVLDSGSAPAINEEFIQQRSHLIQETLASFGAPVPEEPMNSLRPSGKVTSRPFARHSGLHRASFDW